MFGIELIIYDKHIVKKWLPYVVIFFSPDPPPGQHSKQSNKKNIDTPPPPTLIKYYLNAPLGTLIKNDPTIKGDKYKVSREKVQNFYGFSNVYYDFFNTGMQWDCPINYIWTKSHVPKI